MEFNKKRLDLYTCIPTSLATLPCGIQVFVFSCYPFGLVIIHICPEDWDKKQRLSQMF